MVRGMLLSLRRHKWWYPIEQDEGVAAVSLPRTAHKQHLGCLALESNARVLSLRRCFPMV